MPTDREALEIAKRAAPGVPNAMIEYALSVARGEGGYGAAWATPSKFVQEKSKEFGLTGFEGAGSNNWGAVQGTGSAGSFKHIDRHHDGTWYVGNFRKYKTPEEGFLHTFNVIFGGGLRGAKGAEAIKAAVLSGDGLRAVEEQRKNGYFEASVSEYQTAMKRNYEKLRQSLGFSSLSFDPKDQAPGSLSSELQALSGSGLSKPKVKNVDMPTVKRGSIGVPVRLLHRLLAVDTDETQTEPLGVFSLHTETQLKRFQASRGLEVDGVCGPKTWDALIR